MGYIAIAIAGKDRKGIIARISSILAANNVNIVDIEQSVLHGIFSMFLVGEVKDSEEEKLEKIEKEIKKAASELGLEASIEKLEKYEKKEKKLYNVAVIAKDRVGIVRDIATILYELGINIEKTSLTARGDLISVEFICDFYGKDIEKLSRDIKKRAEEKGLDAVIAEHSKFRREKKLVVFDMDSTVVEQEIINAIAELAGVEKEVREITERAMRGEIDFKEALKQRVRFLKGIKLRDLEKVAESITLTPGIEELTEALKNMGYKLALVTGGFTYFAEKIAEKLGFDYFYGNELVIENGIVTGEIKEPIIDAEAKGRIIRELAEREKISSENIIAIGDGANDKIMIKNAGLGIAFNAKEALKSISDGSISKENIMGILNLLKKE